MKKQIKRLKHALAFLSLSALIAVGGFLSIITRAYGNRPSPKNTIVWIEGEKRGVGIIVHKQGNRYAVLTNWHLVNLDGEYTIETHRGAIIPYSDKKQLDNNIDLALLFFTSSDQYARAQLGDSENLSEGADIWIPTYIFVDPSTQSPEKGRSYRLFKGSIERIRTPDRKGYSLVMGGINRLAKSGSPVINDNGQVIGVYGTSNNASIASIAGNSENHPETIERERYAIPSNMARQLAKRIGVSLTQPAATEPSPNHPSSGNIIEPVIPQDSLLDGQTGASIEEPSLPTRPLLD
ncbi:MAG: trypsin-like peptidase domain-containing protein [Cyanobacteria bacterium SBLK]|nr:trypsin-like peptidase domain-containing protein [Cyanobacteria bacterium SBLK]